MRLGILAAVVAAGFAIALVFGLAATALAAGPSPTPALNATPTPTAMGTPQGTATSTTVRMPIPTATPFPTPPPPILDVNFWIAVDGVPGCNTEQGDATCYIAPGATFVVDTYLGSLRAGMPGYGGFDVSLRHLGLTPNHDASTDAWPDCGFPAAVYDELPDTDVVRLGCAVGVPPAGASFYTGLIGTLSFACSHSGSITLIHGNLQTDLIEFDDIAIVHTEDPNTSESLTINCVQPDPATLGLPNTGRASAGQPDQWLPTIIALCAGAALFAAGAWGARRRRA